MGRRDWGEIFNQIQDKEVFFRGGEMMDISSFREEVFLQQSRVGDLFRRNNVDFRGQWLEREFFEGQKLRLMYFYNFFFEKKDGG